MNNESLIIIFLVASLFMELLGWVITHLLCEYKYYWCNGKCVRCHNWKCKFFKSVDESEK